MTFKLTANYSNTRSSNLFLIPLLNRITRKHILQLRHVGLLAEASVRTQLWFLIKLFHIKQFLPFAVCKRSHMLCTLIITQISSSVVNHFQALNFWFILLTSQKYMAYEDDSWNKHKNKVSLSSVEPWILLSDLSFFWL